VSAESHARFPSLFAGRPVLLAPMEDVSDAPFRRICRANGADLCVTEFVRAEKLIHRDRHARRKVTLVADDRPTAIQIYGADPESLAEAARIAEAAEPAFLDINCGCWVPRVAGRGAGAGWLRDPAAMVAMARLVVQTVSLPVTVKTRIGWGPESQMPIVDLARRLEDAGVRALTIHWRTAQMGHAGAADWGWARRAREVVSIPVIVNGDVRSADDVVRALDETGCAGVMIGRAAIDHPWIFAESRALLAGRRLPPPSDEQRRATYRAHLAANVVARGEKFGVQVTRRHIRGYLRGLSPELHRALYTTHTLAGSLALLDGASEQAA
jgi:tRNA-dihydrouridine synthase B